MKLFVDTGNIKDIQRLADLGIIDGVTTNPSLMAKEGGNVPQMLKQICAIVQGPISGEVVATDFDGMIREGHAIAGIHPHMVVKLPFGPPGVKACRALSAEGIRVNMTLIFSAAQALLAAKANAWCVSPFIGRLDDIGHTGMTVIEEIVEIFQNYEFGTQVLVASVRSPLHVVQAAQIGADIATCPAAVIDAMFRHPLTDAGLKKFLEDHEKAQQQAQAAPARG